MRLKKQSTEESMKMTAADEKKEKEKLLKDCTQVLKGFSFGKFEEECDYEGELAQLLGHEKVAESKNEL